MGRNRSPLGVAVVVTTYDVLRLSSRLVARDWTVVVADESHMIKTAEAERTAAFVGVAKRADFLYLLSGTPELSRPAELWTSLDTLCPDGRWGTYREFTARYCEGGPTRFSAWEARGMNRRTLPELRLFLTTVMVRCLKRDVLAHLPPKIVKTTNVQVDGSIPRGLMAEAAEIRREASKNVDNPRAMAFAKTRADAKIMEAWRATGRLKVVEFARRLDVFIKEAGDDKVAIFAHHTDVFDVLVARCAELGLAHFLFTGSTTAKKRNEYASAFRDPADRRYRVGLFSVTAAGVGINLAPARRAIFLELPLTPALLDQAADRFHRIGAVRPVEITLVVAPGTYDDTLVHALRRKSETNTAVLDGVDLKRVES
jgi:SWI/SNF-related matrix-associated actin-dependent regulator 1 of chromatin subfamily A